MTTSRVTITDAEGGVMWSQYVEHDDPMLVPYPDGMPGLRTGWSISTHPVPDPLPDRDTKWRREMESISEDHTKRLRALEQVAIFVACEPGPMISHAANLTALAAWTQPEKWIDNAQSPEERARLHALLEHLHGLVLTAGRGESVPLP